MNDTTTAPNVTLATDFSVEEIKAKLGDRKWRLSNLYYVKNEKGERVLFVPNEVQMFILDNLWFFNIIPKARQLGVTTFFTILYLDQIIFSEHKTAVIIAHTQKDMQKIFSDKVKFAWDNLPLWLKQEVGEPDTNNANELKFANGSSISVALSTRSGTVQFLHISEFGKICRKYPDKAEEIVSGAINTVHEGCMISIESTAEGREGYFYDYTMEAEKNRLSGAELTPLDFKIFFFPWWIDKRYVLEGYNFIISKEDQEYFRRLQDRHGIKLTDGQMRWYVKKKQLMTRKGKGMEVMFREFPATLEEAFSATTEGAYFANEMNKVYTSNRIRMLPVKETLPVDTYWDLGMNDFNVIVFAQTDGPILRIIDLYFNHHEGLAHYVDVLKERKYRYGRHVLPHDASVHSLNDNKTREDTLYELGLTNITVAPKPSFNEGIESVRRLFPHMVFDEEKTQKLTDSLSNYRHEWDAKLGVWKDKPNHDDNSHFADAVRTAALVWTEDAVISDYDKEFGVKDKSSSLFGG